MSTISHLYIPHTLPSLPLSNLIQKPRQFPFPSSSHFSNTTSHSHSLRFPTPSSFSNANTSNDNDNYTSRNSPDFISLLRSILSGGNWWNLREFSKDGPSSSGLSVVDALRRIWALVKDDKWVVFAAFASLTIAAISEVSMPSLLAACIFSAQSGESLVFYKNSRLLIVLCLTSGVCSGIRGCCFGIANTILVKRLRESLYSIILFQDVSFFDTETVGDLTSRLGSDCQRLSHVIGNDLHLIFRNILQGTGALFNLLMLSQPLALSALAICFILSTIFRVYGPYQKEAAKVTQEVEACANEVALEVYSRIRTIRVHGTENEELWRYKNQLSKLTFVKIRESAAYGLWSFSFSFLYRSTQIIAVFFGGLSVATGLLSPEQLTKYVLYCEWLIYATWRLVDNCTSLLQSVGACERLFRLMDLLPSSHFSSKGVELQQLRGDIQFVKVAFCYPSRVQALVIDHLSIYIRANEVTAIVGPSGSGKSTLVKLLLRLFEPTEGEILVDNHPLKDLDIAWLRGGIGYVGQEPNLFHMDIKSNITYGCPGDVRWEAVEWAAKLAYAHDFIASLPEGYNTLVDDAVLSGGQKQRIAIARAIVRNPAVLILDEPTSALDAESEMYISDVLHALKSQSRTIILIAHRLSTVTNADRIIVMDRGKVVEIGSHKELLQSRVSIHS